MRRLGLLFWVAVVAFAQLATPDSSKLPVYRVVDLGEVSTNAINKKGQIVGIGSNGPFIYNGSFRNLNFFGTPSAINDKGAIVGSRCVDPACIESRAFLLDEKGVLTDLMSAQSIAVGINDNGEIIGSVTDPASSVARGFIWRDGVIEYLNFSPADINKDGHVVGPAFGVAPYYLLYTGGTPLTLPFRACCLNDSDIVAGTIRPEGIGPLPPEVYTWRAGTLTPMNNPGVRQSAWLRDINNKGQIVGNVITCHNCLNLWSRDAGALWTGGTGRYLSYLLRDSDRSAWWISEASRINDKGEILARAIKLPQPPNTYNFTSYAVLLQPVDGQ